jgi:hypothetical protein
MSNRIINNSPLPPPPLLQRQSQIFGLNRAIESIMSINEPPKMESNNINVVQSRHILNSLPSTPPSSSQRKRSSFQEKEGNSSSTFTTTKLESLIKHQESPSPSPSPSKRKRSTTNGEESSSNASPSRKGGSKWLSWEDKIILKALISNGEKGIDWKGVLEEINSKRSKDEPRSMASVKLHWSTSMKVKLME